VGERDSAERGGDGGEGRKRGGGEGSEMFDVAREGGEDGREEKVRVGGHG